MSARNALRYLGLMMILALYVVAGTECLTNPTAGVAALSRSNLPLLVRRGGFSLTTDDYRELVRGTGIAFLSCSLLIMLGVGRGFFAFVLAAATVAITVLFFVNIDNPMATSPDHMTMILISSAVTGGLLFVAGSGHRKRRAADANEHTPEKRRERH